MSWICSSLNVPFDPNDIHQAHCIGLSYTDNHSSGKVKARQLFYKSWPRYHTDGSKKPGFSVSVDLTERRYLLLSKAKELIKGNTNISYVYKWY